MLNANTHIILMGKTNTERIMYQNMFQIMYNMPIYGNTRYFFKNYIQHSDNCS